MTINKDSLNWSIAFTARHSDGDIFPPVAEMMFLATDSEDFVSAVAGRPLNEFVPQACRRFIVPKDDVSYRQATQLYPQDSLLLTACVYQFGQGIEDRRLPKSEVFSYRFNPSIDHGLYGTKSLWNDFWETASSRSLEAGCVLYCDIADFYNQIYHHAVENQLADSGFPNQAIKWMVALLESTTAGVSRGVPIGPHAMHIIAEATLVPIDNSLQSAGIRFIRYADDIIIFCSDRHAAQRALAKVAATLDKQQRLMLQKHKTKVYDPQSFQALCAEMIEDRPISEEEQELIAIVKKHSGGDPYATITYGDLSEDEWSKFTEERIESIVTDYLRAKEVDYIRLRWFLRRLTQVGHPGALPVILAHIDSLGPCLANICTYISSIQSIPDDKWLTVGEELLQLLESAAFEDNEYFRLSVLSLFARNALLNHIQSLLSQYRKADQHARREIILAANENGCHDWLRELKEEFDQMDQWSRSAFTYAMAKLPRNERRFFIGRCRYECALDQAIAKHAKRA